MELVAKTWTIWTSWLCTAQETKKMMKLKNNIIAVLGLSLLLSLMSSGSTAQPQRRFFADTGIISGGPNQIIRLTAAGNDSITVRFMETDYMKGPCSPD